MKKMKIMNVRKIAAIVMALTLAAPAALCAKPEEVKATDDVKAGDVDGNGKIEIRDAQLAFRDLLHIEKLTEEQRKAADVVGNANGLNLNDVQAILKHALALIRDFNGMQESPETAIPYPRATAKTELRDGKLYYTISAYGEDISRMYYAIVYDNTCLEVETAECLGLDTMLGICEDIKTESHVALGGVHAVDHRVESWLREDIAQICFRVKGDLKEADPLLLVMNAQEYDSDFADARGKEGTLETDLSGLNDGPISEIPMPIKKYEKGDVYGDGDGVKLNDAQYILKIALNLIGRDSLSEAQLEAADVVGNKDGIKLSDAQAVLKRALNLDVKFDGE